jgi:hypothetical protein
MDAGTIEGAKYAVLGMEGGISELLPHLAEFGSKRKSTYVRTPGTIKITILPDRA